MVLGFLLYEAVDVAYHVGKITFNGASFIYNWYYDINIHNLDNKVRNDEEHIKKLEERVKQLEDMLLIGDLTLKDTNETINDKGQLLLCDSI